MEIKLLLEFLIRYIFVVQGEQGAVGIQGQYGPKGNEV